MGARCNIHFNLNLGSDVSDGIKSIGLSFSQIIYLLATFPVPWARMFTALFQVGGAVTVLGQHFVNLKCMLPSYTEAGVFYPPGRCSRLCCLLRVLSRGSSFTAILGGRWVGHFETNSAPL